jgi:hypothetical protein
VLNVLHDAILVRRFQLALYGGGAIGALLLGIVSVTDSRLPWFIVALFSAGSFVDVVREKPERPS